MRWILSLIVLLGPARQGIASLSLEPLLHSDPLTIRRAFPASALSDGRLRVLVRLASSATAAALEGFDLEPAAGPVVPARVSPYRLQELARRPGVERVEACRLLHLQLDRSLPESGVIEARTTTGLDGSNVVIGIVDTGLDFRHQDFLTPEGRSRILYLLDFSEEATEETSFPSYDARLYSQQDLDLQLELDRRLGQEAPLLVTQRDLYGHGTHVAGIAAGTGAAAAEGFTPFRYVGVAPGASLIGIKANRSGPQGFADADVVHAIQFVFERAAAMDQPAVVNLSLGTQLNPHDGSSNLARAISALTGPDKPGRVIVSAVGNDGGMDLHATGYPKLEGPSRVVLQIPPYEPSPDRELVHLVLYYDRGDLSLELTTPGGRTLGPISTGDQVETQTDEGLIQIKNAPHGPNPDSGRYGVNLIIDERDGVHPRSGDWSIVLGGSALRYDMWLVNPAIRSEQGVPTLRGPLDPDIKLSSPGTAEGVIAVGAYTTRALWNSVAGEVGALTAQPNAHALFSATGPTLDGRFAPDLSAPGELIISSLSRHAIPTSPSSAFFFEDIPLALWASDQVRGLLRGTSQAAPHVTGVVALLLQRRPDLTLPQVREILRTSARTDSWVGPGRAWSPRWGFGKLDATLALAVLDGKQPGPLDPATSTAGVNFDLAPPGSKQKVVITVIPKDATGLPLGEGQQIKIHSTAGRVTEPVHVDRGRYEARFFAEGELGSTARITVRINGEEILHHPQIHLTTRRELVGLPLRSHGGGCAVGLDGDMPLEPWGVMLVVVLWLCAWSQSRIYRGDRR